MTKRELIDQILTENHTAEPAFLAQFSDEQLREYLAHLKWVKQPRKSGNASRFDRYFRNCPSISPAFIPGRWRTAGQAPGAPHRESTDLSVQSTPPREFKPTEPLSLQPPATSEKIDLPPLPTTPPDAPLPEDSEMLEDMQLSPQERTHLNAPIDEPADPDDPAVEQDPKASESPFAHPDTNEENWLF